MNIFVLMAALVAAATARSLCPDTQFCDVTNWNAEEGQEMPQTTEAPH